MQPRNRLKIKALTDLILWTILKAGAISFAGFCGSPSEGRKFLKEVDKFTQPKIKRALNNLYLTKCISFDPHDNDAPIVLTEKGLRRVKLLELRLRAETRPKRWDHLWRLVIFDIPEKKGIRRKFSRELRNLGFFPLQRSVFVFPADCSKLIDEICKMYSLENNVLILLAGSLGKRNDAVKRYFFANPR